MSNNHFKTVRMTQLALLIAIEAVLAFTPFGFIQIPPVSITIMHIPVIIGAIVLGPFFGAILGLSFGVLSMIKATFMAASPVDLLFSPFASGYPVQSLVMCVVPRILLGVIAGYLYRFLSGKMKTSELATGISAGIATLCHTFLVLGCLGLFFNAMALKDIFMVIIGFNGLLELGVGIVVSVAVCRPLLKYVRSHGMSASSQSVQGAKS